MINFQERICCQDSFWSQNVGAKLNGKSTWDTSRGATLWGCSLSSGGHPSCGGGTMLWDLTSSPKPLSAPLPAVSSSHLVCVVLSYSWGVVGFLFFFFFPPATLNPLIWSRKLCQEPSGCAGGISHTCPFPVVLCPCDWDVTGTCMEWGCCRCCPGAGQSWRRSQHRAAAGLCPGPVVHHQELLLVPSLA